MIKHRKEAVVVPYWSEEKDDKTFQDRRIQAGYILKTILNP